MMTSHELARKLLEGPDLPACLSFTGVGQGGQEIIDVVQRRDLVNEGQTRRCMECVDIVATGQRNAIR